LTLSVFNVKLSNHSTQTIRLASPAGDFMTALISARSTCQQTDMDIDKTQHNKQRASLFWMITCYKLVAQSLLTATVLFILSPRSMGVLNVELAYYGSIGSDLTLSTKVQIYNVLTKLGSRVSILKSLVNVMHGK
jgi:hypothetical protein